jgi:hypothetical protein
MVTDVIPPAAESNARSFTSKSLKIAAAATAAAFTVGASAGAAAVGTAIVTPAKLVIDVNAHVDVEEDVHKVTTPSRYKKQKERKGIIGYADTFHASAPLCLML